MKTNFSFGNRLCTIVVIAVSIFVLNYNAEAQLSTIYKFSAANADPNPPGVPLSSPTTLSNGYNTVYPNIPVGFTFQFNGNNYTQLGISSNGFVWFGNTAPSSNVTNPISDATAEAGVICAYGQAMEESEGGSPVFGYQTQGTAPNRTFTVEWYNFADQAIDDGNNVMDMYVILYETTGVIKTGVNVNEYGWDDVSSGEIGLRGASNSDYFNREVDCGSNGSGWLNSIAGTSNSVTCTNNPCYAGSIFGNPCFYTYTPPLPSVNSITTGAVAGSPFCACATVSVSFTSTGTFNVGNNYSAQLSDQTGSFASPVVIGSTQSTSNTGSISATIPCNTLTGTHYRIRVVSDNPITTGTDNGSDIVINQPAGSAGVISSVKNTICQNAVAHLSVSGNSGVGIQWQSSPDSTTGFTNISTATSSSYNTNPISQNTFYRVAVGSGSCTIYSASYKIIVIAAPVASFTSTVNGEQVSFNSDSSKGVTSYFWDFGDDSTSTAANPVHNFGAVNTFHVCLTVTNSSNCNFTLCQNVTTFPTGVNNINSNNIWQVYPDPFSSQLYISMGNSNTTVESVEMYDVLGRQVFYKNIAGEVANPIKLDMSNIKTGVYFIKIKTRDSDFIKSVIKE